MSWVDILTLINGADTLLGIVILVAAARYGLRALRRSEPRPESWIAGHDELDGAPRHWRTGAILDTVHSPTKNPRQDCLLCNPQPTSPPQSALWPGLTAGQLEQLGAKVATSLEPRAKRENED